jgi:hypothetical protein
VSGELPSVALAQFGSRIEQEREQDAFRLGQIERALERALGSHEHKLVSIRRGRASDRLVWTA